MAGEALWRWQFEVDPSRELVASVRQSLAAYNVARAQIDSAKSLAWFLWKAEALVGGAVAEVWGAVAEIHFLWLHESARGRGLGRELLTRIEQSAYEAGARLAVLDTFDFQAPAFYTRHGYQPFGVIEGYADGHRKTFFRKRLGVT